MVDAKYDKLARSIVDVDTKDDHVRYARYHLLEGAGHDPVAARAREYRKQRNSFSNAFDHAVRGDGIILADECSDMPKVNRCIVGDAHLHSDRPKISLSSLSTANSPRSACPIA